MVHWWQSEGRNAELSRVGPIVCTRDRLASTSESPSEPPSLRVVSLRAVSSAHQIFRPHQRNANNTRARMLVPELHLCAPGLLVRGRSAFALALALTLLRSAFALTQSRWWLCAATGLNE